jgi:mono/diheme cytochrome c family protein
VSKPTFASESNGSTSAGELKSLWWLGLVGLAAVVLWFWLNHTPWDDYTRAVLSLRGDPVKGRSIFVMNCVACHGQWATGEVGPSLKNLASRKSDVQIIEQVTSGKTPPMPQFQPDPQEMADLLSYLKQL